MCISTQFEPFHIIINQNEDFFSYESRLFVTEFDDLYSPRREGEKLNSSIESVLLSVTDNGNSNRAKNCVKLKTLRKVIS